MKRNCAILIPAYQPDAQLLSLLDDLTAAGFADIVIVNDGSDESRCGKIFLDAGKKNGVTLITHPVNMGKGAALKSGMCHIYNNLPDCRSVITVDADGQHKTEDVLRIAETADNEPDALILGARRFDGEVPFRSLFGNKLTAFLMRLLLGMKISDTQTGLRAIPRSFITTLLLIPCSRYEFELEMLLAARSNAVRIAEIDIKTVYINDNSSSHFNVIFDSLRIYAVLFRYILVSVLTAITDYLVYVPVLYLCLPFYHEATATAIAVAAGRIAGAALQYTLVRKVVFYSDKPMYSTLPKYILLVICSGCASYLILHSIESSAHWNFYIAKPAAELIIYLANFLIQRDFIFQRGER